MALRAVRPSVLSVRRAKRPAGSLTLASASVGAIFGSASIVLPFHLMTASRLRLMAALGIACLASSVWLAKAAPASRPSILDTIYS